jgi:hypothetical protein
LIRAIFIFRKERQSQNSETKRVKVIPKTSDIVFVIFLTFIILFITNYFIDYAMYR